MRVLTLSCIYPNEKRDFEGRSVAFLDRYLSDLGVQGVTLVLRPWMPSLIHRNLNQWKHLEVENRIAYKKNVTVVFDQYFHIPRRYRQDISAWLMAHQAGKLIDRNGWSFDLIHGQSIFPAALAAYLLSQRYGVPFIVTLRDDLSHLEHMLRSGPVSLRRFYEKMFSHVGAILVQGPALLRDAVQYVPHGRSVPVLLAPNGVDQAGIESILVSLPPAERRSWGQIVSVSGLYRFKGIHENLQALKLLDDRGIRGWRYTIVGDGPYQTELSDLSASLGLADRVTFAGRVPHPEAIRHIRNCDLYSMPSFAEPFGNVYAEAAMCEKPAVGCQGQGAEITIRNHETGFLVPPKDVGALADALEFLLAHPEEAREMGRRGREHVRQFTWERTARSYREVMEKVRHDSRSGSPRRASNG